MPRRTAQNNATPGNAAKPSTVSNVGRKSLIDGALQLSASTWASKAAATMPTVSIPNSAALVPRPGIEFLSAIHAAATLMRKNPAASNP